MISHFNIYILFFTVESIKCYICSSHNSDCLNSTNLPDQWSLECLPTIKQCVKLQENSSGTNYLERGCASEEISRRCSSTINVPSNYNRTCDYCKTDNCNAASFVGLNSLVISCVVIFSILIKMNMF